MNSGRDMLMCDFEIWCQGSHWQSKWGLLQAVCWIIGGNYLVSVGHISVFLPILGRQWVYIHVCIFCVSKCRFFCCCCCCPSL